MNSPTGKIISTLYLAVSDKREAILQSIILNILYQLDEPLSKEFIYEFILEQFQVKLIPEEFGEKLQALVDLGKVGFSENKYSISDDEKALVFRSQKQLEGIEENRYQRFKNSLVDQTVVSEQDTSLLWSKFNEYIFECFIDDGRQAINSFIKDTDFTLGNRQRILSKLKEGLSNEYTEELKRLIISYPNNIDSEEIKYLDSIAEKAEYFFSLGLSEEIYNDAVDVNLDNLNVFADTNVLFSVLDISNNPQSAAVNEVSNIAINTDLGFRLRVLPISITELNTVKNFIKDTIQITEFQPGHIRALLESGDLDEFSQRFYQKKLVDKDAPNPIFVLEDSRTILSSRGIEIYNTKFDFYENEQFIDAKKKEYYDFESTMNRFRAEKGFPPKVKNENQIEHDVMLREAIKQLRKKVNDEHKLRWIGITLDNQLIKFDRYMCGQATRRQSSIIQPNFISPSNFLRRIRAFLPVQTENYKRAFISAMTNLSPKTGNKDKSIEIQRTVGYFHKIGIQDDGAILNVVKNELLYSQLKSIEASSDRDVFLQAEVDKYLEEYRKQVQENRDSYQKIQSENIKQIEAERLQKEKKDTLLEQERGKNANLNRQIDDLTSRLSLLEKERDEDNKERIKQNRFKEFYKDAKRKHRRYFFWFVVFSLLTIGAGVSAVFVNKMQVHIDEYYGIDSLGLYLLIGISILGGILLLIRTFMSKERTKESLKFIWSYRSKKSLEKYRSDLYNQFK